MKKLPIKLLTISLILTSCGKTKSEDTTQKPSLNVEVIVVKAQPYNSHVLTTANILANEQVDLVAPMSGQVLEIYFKEGQLIKKGQSIIRLDDRQWKAQLIGVEAAIDAARKDLDRKKQLLSIEGSSQEEIDNLVASIEQLKSQKQQLLVNIDLANIKAPFSGQLGMRDFSKGAFLQQGAKITKLTEVEQLKVEFSLAPNFAQELKIGDQVTLLVNDDSLTAKIYAIDPTINNDTRTINIRALFKQVKGKELRPGTFAEVLVNTNYDENAILIPTQAVVPSINEQTVYVYKAGKAKRNVVEMGSRTPDNVQIISGLSVGDTVITTGLLQVKEGMGINIQSFIK